MSIEEYINSEDENLIDIGIQLVKNSDLPENNKMTLILKGEDNKWRLLVKESNKKMFEDMLMYGRCIHRTNRRPEGLYKMLNPCP